MNDEFALLPWEYRGSGADLKAHAVIPKLTIHYQVRRFLVKMREGVIYFKDTTTGEVFAVLQRFENQMDAESLVETVRESVAKRNFGHYIVRHRVSLRGYGSVVACVIFNYSNKTGWLKEWFEEDWLVFEKYDNPNDAIKKSEETLFDRVMNPKQRQDVPMQWLQGSQPELQQIMMAAYRVLAPDSIIPNQTAAGMLLTLVAQSPLDVRVANYDAFADFSLFPKFKRTLQERFSVRGMKWEWLNPGYLYDRTRYDRGMEKWGENWRGNWVVNPRYVRLFLPLLQTSTAHERLEAALELRDWLQGKLPEPEIDTLLREALK